MSQKSIHRTSWTFIYQLSSPPAEHLSTNYNLHTSPTSTRDKGVDNRCYRRRLPRWWHWGHQPCHLIARRDISCSHMQYLQHRSWWWSAIDNTECMNDGLYVWVVSERMRELMNEWASIRVTVWSCDRVGGWIRNIPSAPASSLSSASSASSLTP